MKENKQPLIFDHEGDSKYKLFCKVDKQHIKDALLKSEREMFEQLMSGCTSIESKSKRGRKSLVSNGSNLATSTSKRMHNLSRTPVLNISFDNAQDCGTPSSKKQKKLVNPQDSMIHSSPSFDDIEISTADSLEEMHEPLKQVQNKLTGPMQNKAANILQKLAAKKLQNSKQKPVEIVSINKTQTNSQKQKDSIHGADSSTKPDIYKCNYCIETFTDAKNLMFHKKVIHGRKMCFKCQKDFKSTQMLNFHYAASHSAASEEAVSCDTCNRRFVNSMQLQHHQNYFKQIKKSCISSKKSGKKVNPQKHKYEDSDESLEKQSSPEHKHFKSQKQDYEDVHASKILKFSCTLCNKEFPEKFFLLQHNFVEHQSNNTGANTNTSQLVIKREVSERGDSSDEGYQPMTKKARSSSDPDWNPFQGD